jgi:hypothetical protein
MHPVGAGGVPNPEAARETAVTRGVKTASMSGASGVKAPSGGLKWLIPRCTLTPGVVAAPATCSSRRAPQMADVAYVALALGIFLLLALMLRGLEKLQ